MYPNIPCPIAYLASICDKEPTTLRNWIYRKRISTIKCAGIVMIPPSEIVRLVEEGRIRLK
jgi:hypothetical protein